MKAGKELRIKRVLIKIIINFEKGRIVEKKYTNSSFRIFRSIVRLTKIKFLIERDFKLIPRWDSYVRCEFLKRAMKLKYTRGVVKNRFFLR